MTTLLGMIVGALVGCKIGALVDDWATNRKRKPQESGSPVLVKQRFDWSSTTRVASIFRCGEYYVKLIDIIGSNRSFIDLYAYARGRRRVLWKQFSNARRSELKNLRKIAAEAWFSKSSVLSSEDRLILDIFSENRVPNSALSKAEVPVDATRGLSRLTGEEVAFPESVTT